jgi:diguanylate cyclase (GGDEF)-like protein/PAS domain S-box-containing protein
MNQLGRLIKKWVLPDKSILLFCAALLLLVWAVVWWQIDHDRQGTIEMIRQDTDRLARAFEEHVNREIKTNEHYLNSIKAEYEASHSLSAGLEREFRHIAADPLVAAGVVDASGNLVLSSLPNAAGVNLANVPHFVHHIAADSGKAYFGKPFVGRTSKKLSIHMTRRINAADGGFAGIAIITMDPFYFTKFYRDMDFTDQYVIRMLGQDGIIRASNVAAEIGRDMTGAELYRRMNNAAAGFYHAPELAADRPLWVSYRINAEHPVVIQVGRSEEALAPFLQRRNAYLLFAGGVSLFIIVSAVFIVGRMRRQRRTDTLLRTFVSNTPLVFYAFDPKGTFVLSEGLALTGIGLKPGEAVGRSVFELYRDYPEILAAVRQAIDGAPVVFEHNVGEIYFSNRIIPVFDYAGQVTMLVGAAVDITERVRAEQRLAENYAELTTTHEELTAAHEELLAAEEELRAQYCEIDRANIELLGRNAILETLRELAENLIVETDLAELMKTIITRATASIGTQHGNIGLLDEQEPVVHALGGAGLFEQHLGLRLQIDNGIVGEVFRTGSPVIIEDYRTWDKRLVHPDLAVIHGFAMAPLKRGEAVIGVIGVASVNEHQKFTAKELGLLSHFAELASIAVENIRKIGELQRSRKMAQDIFHASADALLVSDIESGEILSVNLRAEKMFNQSECELCQQALQQLIQQPQQSSLLQVIQASMADTALAPFECETVDYAGRRQILELTATPVEMDGTIRALVAIRDVTARKLMEEGMEYLRQRDPLTSAYNRSYFEAEMIRLPVNWTGGIGFFVCDVDGLKLINDTLGHHQGDELLKAVARLLMAGVEAPGYVARIGGDEFAVVLFDPTEKTMEEQEKEYHLMVQDYNRQNPQLPLSLSLGWAAGAADSAETLMKTADNHMYRQKMHQSHSIRSAIVQTLTKALEARDHITEGHADRLGDLMAKLGQQLKLGKQAIADLQLFAKFHDIGKVGIPDSILNKPGRLTPDEMNIMRQHSEIGFRIAKSSPDLEPVADWILKHHEFWDGNGYPLGLSGEEIPLEARLLSIVDTYDAMTSDRPYRKAVCSEEALTEIRRCAGSQFDPELATIFVSLVEQEKTHY